MTKPNPYPFEEDKNHNFFKYDVLAEARNEFMGKYLINDSKLKEIDDIFRKNNYIPIDINSDIVNISKIPILYPNVIVFGGFEYHCWEIPDSKVLPLFKELINKNFIDGILSYGEESFAVEDLKKIKNYCKIYNISFEFNDLPNNLQSRIRYLKKLDYYHSQKAYSKNTHQEEFDKHLDICANDAEDVYNSFKKRAEHCTRSLEKKMKDFKLVVQILSLEEVINTPFIAEELSKKKISFISYVPDKVPR